MAKSKPFYCSGEKGCLRVKGCVLKDTNKIFFCCECDIVNKCSLRLGGLLDYCRCDVKEAEDEL